MSGRTVIAQFIVVITVAGCSTVSMTSTAENIRGATAKPVPGTISAPTNAPDTSSTNSLETLEIDLVPWVSGLNEPVGLASADDGSNRLFVLEKRGVIRIIQNDELMPVPFLDISDRVGSTAYERGLLGLAFHPEFGTNGYFFVNYTNRNGDTVISRFTAAQGSNQADLLSETPVLFIAQPAPNHNGGNLVFGPDGYLYIGTGDGGGAGDTYGNGQNWNTYLGKMLRIDVDVLPYSIPPDNPFVTDSRIRPEIWATGLRNPWRYSFDRLTGDLYIADVGQGDYEEVNFQPAGIGGENYGWPTMEGLHCYSNNGSCGQVGLTLPVAEYPHADNSCSITGGYVYRGAIYPTMNGIYFFGDFCSGFMWGMQRQSNGGWPIKLLLSPGIGLSTFGEDESGELYVADMYGGTIYKLVAR